MITEYQATLAEAVEQLGAAKALLSAEIANYPTPISGCDAQFNHLLSQRAMIANVQHVLDHPPFIPTSRQLEPVAAAS